MTPNPLTGLVEVVDRKVDPKTKAVTHHKMWPIDFKEAVLRGGVLEDSAPRYVLKESYTEA